MGEIRVKLTQVGFEGKKDGWGLEGGYKVLGGMRDLVPYDSSTSQHLVSQDC